MAPKPGPDVSRTLGRGGIATALGSLINPLAALLPFVTASKARTPTAPA